MLFQQKVFLLIHSNILPATASLVLSIFLSACTPGDAKEEDGRIALPSSLTEISGLASASDDSVFAHDDERAVIYELRASDGEVLRSFQLGRFAVAGDFEGVATLGDRIYLITSDGQIYDALIGADGDRVDYQVHDSGVGEHCEVEGLSQTPSANGLLVLCKEMNRKQDRDHLHIYRWETGCEVTAAELWLKISLKDLLGGSKSKNFAPSALEWDPQKKQLWIASARSRDLLVLSETGALIERRKLDEERHPQAEGLTLLPDDRLILADEQADARSAYLTIYPGLPPQD